VEPLETEFARNALCRLLLRVTESGSPVAVSERRRKKMSLNKILLIGNLGSDPEVRYTQTGKPVASFRIATNRRYTIEGTQHEETEWFNIVAFGRMAEISSEFLKKGKSVFVEGRCRTHSWIDANGAKHFKTDVIVEGLRLIGKRNDGVVPAQDRKDDEPF
jgi:single-strand DNA-binding protein